ncbi:MAG: hypothetical protein KKC75_08840 [Nanoarchaeota archaeon]|nr:hypothetical protein [Nanoarchaeota archaeon]MBU1004953.1 hypothetical protein [Nanoarchaeota archaeon]MBU1946407.1 hypothetical protein [Nanoarchaeota archaeon]
MKLRKRVIGDLYLSSSILFIFLTFVAVISRKNNLAIALLAVGMLIALIGVRTKQVMIEREKQETKRAVNKKRPAKR